MEFSDMNEKEKALKCFNLSKQNKKTESKGQSYKKRN